MKTLKKIPALLLMILFLSSAYSHPGHDHHEHNTLLHHTTSPYPIIPIILFLLFAVWILIKNKSIAEKIKSTFKK